MVGIEVEKMRALNPNKVMRCRRTPPMYAMLVNLAANIYYLE